MSQDLRSSLVNDSVADPFGIGTSAFHSVVLESMTEGVSVADEDGFIVYTNAAEDAMFGYSRGELIGKHVTALNDYAPDENTALVAKVIAALRAHGTWQGEWCNRRKDGSAFFTESRITAMRHGERVYWVCVQRDVTQQRAEREALQAAERRTTMLVESINDHFVSYDREWRYTYVNAGAARVLGKPREALLGQCIWDLFPDAVGNQYYQEVHEAARTGKPIVSEHYYPPFDTWFENRIYPTADGVSVFSSDISERKRTEAALAASECALREADRRKDEFLAILAHELRNPLSPIRSATHIVSMPSATPEAIATAHRVIERQVRHMARLLDDLLDVSRISRGKIELRMEPVRLARIFESAGESAAPAMQARRHTLTVEVDPELTVVGDAVRLAQVVSNLLSNAAKYTDVGGDIRLQGRRSGEVAEIVVSDNGIGLQAEDLQRVFEIFTQIHTPQGCADGGLGIGLSLVKGIAELHGGSVEARSEGLGRGSVFIVKLPIDKGRDVPVVRAASPHKGHALRIVVADDNADALEALALMLRLEQHDVWTAADGETALQLFLEYRPDVLLLDIGMPGLDGLELARRVRAHDAGKNVRLVAITGWGQKEDRMRALAAGFDAHLVKPVDADALLRVLAEDR
ncbi:MAG: PAS domain S-box protein [Gammaproteobacteria bacterium]